MQKERSGSKRNKKSNEPQICLHHQIFMIFQFANSLRWLFILLPLQSVREIDIMSGKPAAAAATTTAPTANTTNATTTTGAAAANANTNAVKPRARPSKMPTAQEMQELYDRITPLQKIVTLQHIYSLYMAAAQQTEKKDVSFNIIQLQRMINSNPLVNPDFDFLDVAGYLNTNHNNNKGPVSPVQLIQILTESLTLRDERGRNEQVIQQVPNTMLFKLSKFIDLNFVKDRLIKLLNSYKNTALKEVDELETKWKAKKLEITNIENGKMDDSVLYEEFLKDLKRKRSTGTSSKNLTDKSISPSVTPVENKESEKVNVKVDPIVEKKDAVVEKNKEIMKENVKEHSKQIITENVKENIKDVNKETKDDDNNNLQVSEDEKKDVFVDAPETMSEIVEDTDKPREKQEKNDENIAHKTRSAVKHKLEEEVEKSPKKMKQAEKEVVVEPKVDVEPEEKPVVQTRPRTRRSSIIELEKEKEKETEKEKDNELDTKDKDIKDEDLKEKDSKDTKESGEVKEPILSKKFLQLSTQLITNISSHRIASMFLHPVNKDEEPEYYKLIKKPIDLKNIVRMIKGGKITTIEELELNMQIMFTNAIMYNDTSDGDIYESILDMMKEWNSLIDMLKENI